MANCLPLEAPIEQSSFGVETGLLSELLPFLTISTPKSWMFHQLPFHPTGRCLEPGSSFTTPMPNRVLEPSKFGESPMVRWPDTSPAMARPSLRLLFHQTDN